jgi:type I restriction enzyme R subunit
MRPVFSPTEYIQIKGRGTRLFTFGHEGKTYEKEYFHLLEFCAVAEYFEETYDYSVALKVPKAGKRQKAKGNSGAGPVREEHGNYDVGDTQCLVR